MSISSTLYAALRPAVGSEAAHTELVGYLNAVEFLSVGEATVLDGVTAGTVTASKAVVVDANQDIGDFRNVGYSGALTAGAGAATAAVALRLGTSATEGLEIKVYDETITLTNAVADDTNCVIPAGAVILSVQGNLETVVAGDGGGGDAVADIGIGISGGDEDAYAEFGALTKNTKADAIPDWAVLAGETTLAIFALQADGNTAATEEFAAGGKVRIRVVYAVCNSLDYAA